MGYNSRRKFRKKLLKRTNRDRKVVEYCIRCGKRLAKNSLHHNKCHSCWIKIGKSIKKQKFVV